MNGSIKLGTRYDRELETGVIAVREAAKLCVEVQSSIETGALKKKDRSPVTVADFGSQALICRILGDAFKSDPIIAEEDSTAIQKEENKNLLEQLVIRVNNVLEDAGADQICRWIDRGNASDYSSRVWTLDPIDGTKGFLRGDQYAISLALVIDGEITLGILGCPNLPVKDHPENKGVCFYGVNGAGAFEMPIDGGQSHPLRVSSQGDTSAIRFCESVEGAHSSHGDASRIARRLGIKADPVRIDSQAKYAMVARGAAEAYLRLPKNAEYQEKIWDHAGGVLVVTEAGGKVTDINGNPLQFTHGSKLMKNKGVIVSNGRVHKPIIEAIKALEIGKL